MIYPDNPGKIVWNIIVQILLLIILVYMPMTLAKMFDEGEGTFIKTFDFTIDILFMVDIVVNFFSVITDDNDEWNDNR